MVYFSAHTRKHDIPTLLQVFWLRELTPTVNYSLQQVLLSQASLSLPAKLCPARFLSPLCDPAVRDRVLLSLTTSVFFWQRALLCRLRSC